MKTLFTILLRIVAYGLVCLAYLWALTAHGTEFFDATVRIHHREGRGQSYGTGTCFEVSGGQIAILTNAHVVGRQQSVSVTIRKGILWHPRSPGGGLLRPDSIRAYTS